MKFLVLVALASSLVMAQNPFPNIGGSSNGGGGGGGGSSPQTFAFTSQASPLVMVHSLGTLNVLYACRDSSGYVVTGQATPTDVNTLSVAMAAAFTGTCVVTTGGVGATGAKGDTGLTGPIATISATAPLTGGGSSSTVTVGVDTTKVSQKFFGTSAPGSVAGNLPGDIFVDTTALHVYVCEATSGTAAPACTSVAANGWTDQNSATNLLTGTLPAARVPVPSASTLGGVQSHDCTATGAVGTINTDGTSTCVAAGATMAANAGWINWNENAGTVSGETFTAGTTYYYQKFLPFVITPKTLTAAVNLASGSYLAVALYDNLAGICTKVSGTDVRVQGSGSNTMTLFTFPSAGAIGPGTYYIGFTSSTANAVIQGVQAFAYLNADSGGPHVFTGGNAPTGSGATITMPATCGTKSKLADNAMLPLMYVFP